ncbi:hypothetical protein ATANTOWER_004244 [Ataeniobius toweri]|uniref:Uncharacterized protein n=1 Tax=Ataeniobius toweri TaxID=208326 RepID=A0ABU7CEH7_9TELE|nr:hypothetical protein [Ataeniobius toweri]
MLGAGRIREGCTLPLACDCWDVLLPTLTYNRTMRIRRSHIYPVLLPDHQNMKALNKYQQGWRKTTPTKEQKNSI